MAAHCALAVPLMVVIEKCTKSMTRKSATEESSAVFCIRCGWLSLQAQVSSVTREQGRASLSRLRLLFAAAVAPLFLGQIEGGVGSSDHLLYSVMATLAGADPDTDGEGDLKSPVQCMVLGFDGEPDPLGAGLGELEGGFR